MVRRGIRDDRPCETPIRWGRSRRPQRAAAAPGNRLPRGPRLMTNVAEPSKALHAKPDGARGARLSDALPPSTLTKWLKDMLLIREFEVRCMQAYQQARIGGFCHIYIGQEACAVGTIGSVNHDDPV